MAARCQFQASRLSGGVTLAVGACLGQGCEEAEAPEDVDPKCAVKRFRAKVMRVLYLVERNVRKIFWPIALRCNSQNRRGS